MKNWPYCCCTCLHLQYPGDRGWSSVRTTYCFLSAVRTYRYAYTCCYVRCCCTYISFDHYEHARSAGSISPPLRRLPCIPVYICLLWKPPSAFIWPPLRAPTFFVLLIADDLFSSEFLSFDSFHVFSFPFIVFFPFFFSIVYYFSTVFRFCFIFCSFDFF